MRLMDLFRRNQINSLRGIFTDEVPTSEPENITCPYCQNEQGNEYLGPDSDLGMGPVFEVYRCSKEPCGKTFEI